MWIALSPPTLEPLTRRFRSILERWARAASGIARLRLHERTMRVRHGHAGRDPFAGRRWSDRRCRDCWCRFRGSRSPPPPATIAARRGNANGSRPNRPLSRDRTSRRRTHSRMRTGIGLATASTEVMPVIRSAISASLAVTRSGMARPSRPDRSALLPQAPEIPPARRSRLRGRSQISDARDDAVRSRSSRTSPCETSSVPRPQKAPAGREVEGALATNQTCFNQRGLGIG